jgi:hypothetical protein
METVRQLGYEKFASLLPQLENILFQAQEQVN